MKDPTPVTAMLESQLVKILDALAKEKQITRAELIRRALEKYVVING